jgi:anti-sigma regulatory factor (Ser/Thr protein kinase)
MAPKPSSDHEAWIPISNDADIVKARQVGRELAARAGCTPTDLTMVATAISEIARNIVTYARGGQMEMRLVEEPGRIGVKIVATDEGPGIDNLERALEDGYTTGVGLGLGLPGTRRLVDDFSITSEPGHGTRVVMYKWCGTSDRRRA